MGRRNMVKETKDITVLKKEKYGKGNKIKQGF